MVGRRERSEGSSDREKWSKIFDGLVKLLKTQKEQLEILLAERKLLEDRVKIQHERWVSDVRLRDHQISLLKANLVSKSLASSVEAAKFNLMVGSKERESYLNGVNLEQGEEDLAEFSLLLLLDHLANNPSVGSKEPIEREGTSRHDVPKLITDLKLLEEEVQKLKLEYQNLSSEKNSEISALVNEKRFVWNQYGVLETNLSSKLKGKQAEIELANDKITSLLLNLEGIESRSRQKDVTIDTLNAKVASMEAETCRQSREILRLSQELQLLDKHGGNDLTSPSPRVSKTKTSSMRVRSARRDSSNVVVKKEASCGKSDVRLTNSKKEGAQILKRKSIVDDDDVLGIHMLFSSSFKVPKVKISPTLVK